MGLKKVEKILRKGCWRTDIGEMEQLFRAFAEPEEPEQKIKVGDWVSLTTCEGRYTGQVLANEPGYGGDCPGWRFWSEESAGEAWDTEENLTVIPRPFLVRWKVVRNLDDGIWPLTEIGTKITGQFQISKTTKAGPEYGIHVWKTRDAAEKDRQNWANSTLLPCLPLASLLVVECRIPVTAKPAKSANPNPLCEAWSEILIPWQPGLECLREKKEPERKFKVGDMVQTSRYPGWCGPMPITCILEKSSFPYSCKHPTTGQGSFSEDELEFAEPELRPGDPIDIKGIEDYGGWFRFHAMSRANADMALVKVGETALMRVPYNLIRRKPC